MGEEPAGRVTALHVHPAEHWVSMAPTFEIRFTPDGIEGDVHEGRDKRAVLMVEAADLEHLGLRPGDLREQITVDLPGLMQLEEGTRLETGEAVLEITGPCEGCTHIGEHVGVDDTEAFRVSLAGRRGMLARVESVDGEGVLRVGDPIFVVEPSAT